MAYRLIAAERDIEQQAGVFDLTRERVAIHEEQINGKGGLVNAVAALSVQVEGLRKALWVFAASIMLSAITISMALLGHVWRRSLG